jgi:hypothetical protein
MSQEVPERQNRNRPRDHPILVALIGAVALVVGPIIGEIFTHGGNGERSPQPSSSSQAKADSSVKPPSQASTPTIVPSSERAASGLTAIILKPTADAMVPLCPSVSGTALHVPGNTALWLFIQIPDQNDRPARWYVVAKLSPASDGKWFVQPFQVGDPGPGRPYWLEVFASNISVTGRITAADMGNDALGSIPTGFDSRPLTTVPVRRENTSTNETCT